MAFADKADIIIAEHLDGVSISETSKPIRLHQLW